MESCGVFEQKITSTFGARGKAGIIVGVWSVVLDAKPDHGSKVCVFMWWGCCCCTACVWSICV